MSIEEVDGLLCITLRGVIAGKMEAGVGSAAAAIARAIVGVRQVGKLEAELVDMREQIAVLADRRTGS